MSRQKVNYRFGVLLKLLTDNDLPTGKDSQHGREFYLRK